VSACFEAFAQRICTTISHTSPPLSSTPTFSYILQIVNISDCDIQKAVKRMRQIKSV